MMVATKPILSETEAALMLSALGNESRLRVYRLLVKAGHDGMSFGDIQQRLSIPPSTLSHHISALSSAELVTQRREGRANFSSANYVIMDDLLKFLTDECCAHSKQAVHS